MISIDDFKKVEMRVGEIRSVVPVPGSEKLLRFVVNFGLQPSAHAEGSADRPTPSEDLGKEDVRQVVSGIAKYFPDLQTLVGKRFTFATNLPPRSIMGFESQAMILAVGGDNAPFAILEAGAAAPGSRVR